MARLGLDTSKINRCRELAKKIAVPVERLIGDHTTVAIERTVLRLLGVNGAIRQPSGMFPEANVIIEDL
ncbi:MAG TPA: lysine 5,6-aminomutase subunit alpha, partial [Bdellovibrionota bacterium]|nr:lysine 5,6-aminomutase subunit alpha [Bdellovibrionota bacterium]